MVPSRYADADELLALCSVLADHDAQARVSLLGIGLLLAVIALGTNYAGKGARNARGK